MHLDTLLLACNRAHTRERPGFKANAVPYNDLGLLVEHTFIRAVP